MTQVHIDIKRTTPTGVDVPLLVGMVWSPSKAHTAGDSVIVPESFPVTLNYAPVTINVTPSQMPDWVWRVRYWVDSTRYEKYLIVPASATPVEFTDLVEVEPGTLSPDVEPEAAWWASVEYMLRGVILAPSDPVPAGLPPGSLVFRTP